MPRNEYVELMRMARRKQQQLPECRLPATVEQRDRAVLNDPLYPPWNRSDSFTYNGLRELVSGRDMYVATNQNTDTYRLVGYLVNKDERKDAGGNVWKLFGRQKDRNVADFYMVPASKDFEVKVPVKDAIVRGRKMRRMDDIPPEVLFSSAMLNQTPYEFVELDKADLSVLEYL